MEEELKVLRAQLSEFQNIVSKLQAEKQASKSPQPVPTAPTLKLINPAPFSGKTSIGSWIFQVENFLNGHPGISDKQGITYASALLEGEAATWWQAQSLDRTTFKELRNNWSRFKEAITDYFTPVNSKKQARDRLAALRQTSSVRTYATEFRKVILEIGNISEDEKLDRFVRGLKFSVRKEVELREPQTVTEAIGISERYDSLSFALSRARVPFFPPKANLGSTEHVPMEINRIKIPKLTEELKIKLRQEGKCFFCRKEGHMISECPVRTPQATESKN